MKESVKPQNVEWHNERRRRKYALDQLKVDIDELNATIASQADHIQQLKQDVEFLEDQVQREREQHQPVPLKDDSGSYTTDVRLWVYTLLGSNTATSHIPSLLARIYNTTEDKVPSETTVRRMAIELGVLSDLQVSEVLFSTPGLCLGFDASTQEGTHFNVVHINSATDYYMMDLDELPGGTHQDYGDQICSTVNRMANLYHQLHGHEHHDHTLEETQRTMTKNIACCITDRASVNAKTVQLLQERWSTSIVQAFCHLHPLETLSRDALACLKGFETEKHEQLFSGTSIADKLLLAIDKMRYHDASGDPMGFTSYLMNKNLGKGLWVRTRGNRLHVKLRNAETCVRYHSNLVDYLKNSCLKTTPFKDAILVALTSDTALQEMTALSIYSIILSKPWMKRLYVGQKDEMSHWDAFRLINKVISKLEVYIGKGEKFTVDKIDSDLFGSPLITDIMGQPIESGADIWRAGAHLVRVSQMVMKILECTLAVLKHQYADYLALTNEELVEREALTSTPVHNIAAEEEVGMVSAAQKKAPGATMVFHASKIKSVRNRSVGYLSGLPAAEQKKRIALAVAGGRSTKQEAILQGQALKAEVVRRIGVKHEEAVQKSIRSKQRANVKVAKALEKNIIALKDAEVNDLCEQLKCSPEQAATVHSVLILNFIR